LTEPGFKKHSAAESSAPYLTVRKFTSNFEELALPLFESSYKFARRLTRNEADAEDLVQEAYLKAFRSFYAFEPGSNFRAWLFRILKNTYLTWRNRAQTRHVAFLDLDGELAELPSDSPDAFSTLIDKTRLAAVQSAIQQMPVIFRDVLVLRDFEGATYRETAHALAIPVGTVMSRLARARKVIRESIQCTPHTVPRVDSLEAGKTE
jgi:RNA polymerase sigma factor (sigma-70 family)